MRFLWRKQLKIVYPETPQTQEVFPHGSRPTWKPCLNSCTHTFLHPRAQPLCLEEVGICPDPIIPLPGSSFGPEQTFLRKTSSMLSLLWHVDLGDGRMVQREPCTVGHKTHSSSNPFFWYTILWPWANHSISWWLNFLSCKIGSYHLHHLYPWDAGLNEVGRWKHY